MANIRIGVLVDSLGLPAKDGLARASELGFSAAELAARGQIDPRELGRTGRRHLAKYVQGLGLSLTGLDGDLGGRRFADPARVQEYIERARRVLEMAAEVGAPRVSVHTGGLPENPDDPAGALVLSAVRELADHADRVGTVLAVRTGGEPTDRLHGLVRTLGNPSLKVEYDPAALLMAGRDPVESVAAVADELVALRARDGVGRTTGHGREVALGRGELDYRALLGALAEAGYYGVHTLARERSDDPAGDLLAGKRFLESL